MISKIYTYYFVLSDVVQINMLPLYLYFQESTCSFYKRIVQEIRKKHKS